MCAADKLSLKVWKLYNGLAYCEHFLSIALHGVFVYDN